MDWSKRMIKRKEKYLLCNDKPLNSNDETTNKTKPFCCVWYTQHTDTNTTVASDPWAQVMHCCKMKRSTVKSQKTASELGPRKECKTLVASSFCIQLMSVAMGSQWKSAVAVIRSPSPLLYIVSTLFCQCDPFMRTDLVISGQEAGDSFTVIMKAATPKSRAAVVQAQGCVNTVVLCLVLAVLCLVLAEFGAGALSDPPQRNTSSGVAGITPASWKQPTLPLSTCWSWTIIIVFDSSSDK